MPCCHLARKTMGRRHREVGLARLLWVTAEGVVARVHRRQASLQHAGLSTLAFSLASCACPPRTGRTVGGIKPLAHRRRRGLVRTGIAHRRYLGHSKRRARARKSCQTDTRWADANSIMPCFCECFRKWTECHDQSAHFVTRKETKFKAALGERSGEALIDSTGRISGALAMLDPCR